MYYTQMKKAAFICNAELANTDWVIFGGIRMQIWIQPWFWEEREGPETKNELSESLLLPKGRKKKYIYIYNIYMLIPIICKSK